MKGKTDAKIWKDLKTWLGKNVDPKIDHKIFATGGNINKVHKMVGSNTSEIQIRKVTKLRKELAKMTLEAREDVYQLKPDRADVIVPACEIFEFILKELKVKNFFVPKIGLSDGMIYDLHLSHQ